MQSSPTSLRHGIAIALSRAHASHGFLAAGFAVSLVASKFSSHAGVLQSYSSPLSALFSDDESYE